MQRPTPEWMNEELEIAQQHYRITDVVSAIPVMWSGWDEDDRAWLVRCNDGHVRIFAIGRYGLVLDQARVRQVLTKRVEAYKRAVELTERALANLEVAGA